MTKQMSVSVRSDHTLIGIFEDERLTEIFLDRPDQESAVGNIYLGQVRNILQNIQSAFVDIGVGKDAFLPGDDVVHNNRVRGRQKKPLQAVLKPGQMIAVQVEKDEIADKGKKITMDISLPGRFLVLFPFHSPKINISKRIDDSKEEKRLRDLLTDVKGSNDFGWIIRTIAEGQTKRAIQSDAKALMKHWLAIAKEVEQAKGIKLLHRELTPIEQVLRDQYNDQFNRILVDNLKVKKLIDKCVSGLSPRRLLKRRITEYVEPDVLLETFNFKRELQRALNRKVWLKCGGYLIIEETETLTAIDVNTGKNVKGKQLDQAILNTNLEAAEEIARQLSLRGIGGIIVIDFIDMQSERDCKKVVQTINKALSHDRVAYDVSMLSDMGLVQISRKRTGESLVTLLSEECPHCQGNGRVLTLRN